MADQILISEEISAHLDSLWKNQLLKSFLGELTLQRLAPAVARLYERYRDYEELNIQQKALINSSLAITRGAFPPDSIPTINEWLSGLGNTSYRSEAPKLIDAFFDERITMAEHANMLKAVYTLKQNEAFWESYWGHFQSIISNSQRSAVSADLLSFWFEQSIEALKDRRYIVPTFFLELPAVLGAVADEKSNRGAMQALTEQLSRKEWFTLTADHFAERKKGLLDRFGRS
jgi:hypothetical protein